jgi:hypothetical protein
MYARAVDEAAERLRELRFEERARLGFAALALVLGVGLSRVHPTLAASLFVGGLAVGVIGARSHWLRWDLVDRLAADRDAYVISEVLAYGSREASQERRELFATWIRRTLELSLDDDRRIAPAAEELEGLACQLEDRGLELDPVCAVACMRLLTDPIESPLLNPGLPAEDLRSRVRQIRAGFRPRRLDV